MSVIRKLIKIFLHKKICFKKNNHKDVIFLDKNYANLNLYTVSSVIINFSEINIFYALIALWQTILNKHKNLNLKDLYLKNLYESYSPKIAIGHEITTRIFECKKICPHIVAIAYQHNYLLKHEPKVYKETLNNYTSDYFYVFDELHKEILSSFVKSNFIIAGSIKNNEIKLSRKKKKYGIMFISEFSSYCQEFYLECQSRVLKILGEYCKENNEKLCIALTSRRAREKEKPINFNDEINFINNSVKNFEIENISNYELANLSEITICISSNLGFELFARKFKVLFLWFLDHYSNEFLNPYGIENNSEFFISKFETKLIHEKITKLKNINDDEWGKIAERSNIKIKYDEENSLLKGNIYKNLNKNYLKFN